MKVFSNIKKKTLIPVILAGGMGSRLWPLSREAHPKPFIKLDDGQSLIQKTYLRALNLANVEEIITVTNRDLFFYTKDEFSEIISKSVHHTFLLEFDAIQQQRLLWLRIMPRQNMAATAFCSFCRLTIL